MRKEIGDLKSALDEQAQHSRRECLEIRGVPASQGEDTNKIVKKIGSLIDADVNDTDISISHRISIAKIAPVYFSQSGAKLRIQDGGTHARESQPCWKTTHRTHGFPWQQGKNKSITEYIKQGQKLTWSSFHHDGQMQEREKWIQVVVYKQDAKYAG